MTTDAAGDHDRNVSQGGGVSIEMAQNRLQAGHNFPPAVESGSNQPNLMRLLPTSTARSGGGAMFRLLHSQSEKVWARIVAAGGGH